MKTIEAPDGKILLIPQSVKDISFEYLQEAVKGVNYEKGMVLLVLTQKINMSQLVNYGISVRNGKKDNGVQAEYDAYIVSHKSEKDLEINMRPIGAVAKFMQGVHIKSKSECNFDNYLDFINKYKLTSANCEELNATKTISESCMGISFKLVWEHEINGYYYKEIFPKGDAGATLPLKYLI